MRRKLLISAGSVIALSAISMVAYASTFSGTKIHTGSTSAQAVFTPVITEIPAVTSIPEVAVPVPTNEVQKEEQSASMNFNTEETYLLAKMAMAEAEDQDTEGKALVILVIINRVLSGEFPDSVEEVIFQQGQFSPISNGRFDKVEPNKDCWKAVDLVMKNKWNESAGALYFESESASTWHRDNLQFLFQHGDHIFYTDKGE